MASTLRCLSVIALVGLATTSCAVDAQDGDDEWEDEPTGATEEELKSGVSCSPRAVTGYNRGSPYKMSVITVGGKPTSLPTAHAFLKMQAAADRAGVSLSIRSGFRSNDEQKYLYNCYVTKRCNNGNLAARPGYSNHQNGRALDLATTNWSWVSRNASKFGFRATVPSERWHYEYAGADPGGVCGRNSGAGPDEATGVDDDDEIDAPAPAPAAAGGGCPSATLGRVMPEGSCVQSSSTELFYQCNAGQWYRGVSGNRGPYGTCSSVHPLD